MPLFGKRVSQTDASGAPATPATPAANTATTANTAGGYDLRLPDVSLHYVTWGQPTTPERTVIFVHGLTASHKEFATMGPALADQG